MIVSLHPEILLGVDIDTVDTSLNAHFRQDRRRVTRYRLSHRVEDTIVHALTEPQITIDVFPHVIDVVVTQCGCIAGVGEERTETIAVVTVQTIRCTNPDIPLGILEDIVNL